MCIKHFLKSAIHPKIMYVYLMARKKIHLTLLICLSHSDEILLYLPISSYNINNYFNKIHQKSTVFSSSWKSQINNLLSDSLKHRPVFHTAVYTIEKGFNYILNILFDKSICLPILFLSNNQFTFKQSLRLFFQHIISISFYTQTIVYF